MVTSDIIHSTIFLNHNFIFSTANESNIIYQYNYQGNSCTRILFCYVQSMERTIFIFCIGLPIIADSGYYVLFSLFNIWNLLEYFTIHGLTSPPREQIKLDERGVKDAS